ncbi:MAG: GLPGLI family protein [Bacteroidota bacterium]
MKKTVWVFIGVFLMMSSAFSQDFKGVATYRAKTSINADLDGRPIPEERKQRIRENLKRAMNRTYTLTFDRIQSIYEQEEELDAPTGNSQGRGFRLMPGSMGGGSLYKNIQQQGYSNQREMFGKNFLIKDSLAVWEWQLGSETKKIGNYTCYKATVEKKPDTLMFDRFRRMFRRGRDRQGETPRDSIQKDSSRTGILTARMEEPQTQVITAWYTPEIPISQGPGPYWGLPGLILEVNDGRTAILCSKLELNPKGKLKLEEPTKGKVVGQKEYDAIMAEKMEEMSQRFRNGNRRGGSGGRIPRS